MDSADFRPRLLRLHRCQEVVGYHHAHALARFIGYEGEMVIHIAFYVSIVVKRWWDIITLMPWPDSLAMKVRW